MLAPFKHVLNVPFFCRFAKLSNHNTLDTYFSLLVTGSIVAIRALDREP